VTKIISNYRINYLDNFRAIAILIIILGHAFKPVYPHSFINEIFGNLITGGSAFFVFISGFFFDYLYLKKFNYLVFLRKKFLNIAIPYLILSVFYIIGYYLITGSFKNFINIDFMGINENYINFIVDIFSGRHLVIYWYIPFIMMIYVLSSPIISYCRLKLIYQIIIVSVFFIISAIFHRNTNPMQNLFYFLPYYLLGILYSQNIKIINQALLKYPLFFFLAFLISLFYSVQFYNSVTLSPFVLNLNLSLCNSLDFQVFQKIIYIFFLLSVLLQYLNKFNQILKFIAVISFPLFLIHPLVISLLSFLNYKNDLPPLYSMLLNFSLFFSLSVFIAVFCKSIFGKYSRYIIGY